MEMGLGKNSPPGHTCSYAVLPDKPPPVVSSQLVHPDWDGQSGRSAHPPVMH